jgi:ribonuclease HII
MPSFAHEKLHGFYEGKIVCGVDEAGRGPLAGPVMAAAVILPADLPRDVKKEIRDSKKMTPLQRENLFAPLTQLCKYSIAEASVVEIARLNILWASMLAMRRAIEGLKTAVDVALIDGNRAPDPLACKTVTIVEGDDKSLSIAAASILAKVARDCFMKELAARHPGYGWEHNFGYGTPGHIAALRHLGPTDWHRAGFQPVMQMLLDFSDADELALTGS